MVQTVTGSKNLKKAAAITALLAMFVQPTTAFASGIKKAADITGNQTSNIYFGQYWQSSKGSGDKTVKENYNYEGVKYRVLNNTTTAAADGQILLLSDKALYADAFNTNTADGNVWNTSKARQTLGAMSAPGATAPANYSDLTTGFAKDAFSAAEYSAIATTTHTAGGTYDNSTCSSSDKLFLLSADEVNGKYGFASGTAASDTRKAAATDLAQNVKMYGNGAVSGVYSGNAVWWLRSPGYGSIDACDVTSDGSVYVNDDMRYDYVSARAALNLDSSSILFLSAAAGGKSAVAAGDGFALADYTGSDYKLTLTDSTLSKPAVTLTSNTGKLGGTFSGASTGTKKYLSVFLVDTSGNGINYAKLADCSTAGSGNFSGLSFANVADGNYKLQFVSEEANGDKQTDYVSQVNEQTVAVSGGKLTKINDRLLPAIDKTTAEFDKNKPADLTFTLTNVPQIAKVMLGEQEITQYSYANGTFTLKKDALASKATGDYMLTIMTEEDCVQATIMVKDSGLPSPTIDKTTAVFDKNNPADITFTLTNVEKVTKVLLGEEEITQYSYANGTFTLKEEALAEKETGDYPLTICTNNGFLKATITVKDGSSTSGGGGGCNAGFGALALLFAVPMFYRKKK